MAQHESGARSRSRSPRKEIDDDSQRGSSQRGSSPLLDQESGVKEGVGSRPRPLCWHGAKCRNLRDPAHCAKYDHQMRPCKFGAACRRKGKGCRYEHPSGPSSSQERVPGPGKRLNGTNNNSISLDRGEPDPERPVPYIFFLVLVCAVGLLALPLLGACNGDIHRKMCLLGLILLLPFMLLELALCTSRKRVYGMFFSGDYSERASYRDLFGLVWYPQKIQLLRYMSGDQAGNNIEQYATWETNDVQQQYENAIGGNRDGGQVYYVGGGLYQLNFPDEMPACQTSPESDGSLPGIGLLAKFDGTHIVASGGAWAKAGYWRLDFVTKFALFLFVTGVLCIFVALSMPPGVPELAGAGELGVGSTSSGRLPLKAVLVVDGSESIRPEMWTEMQGAGKEFVHALQETYGGSPGDLNVGVVQFSTIAKVEQPVSSDIGQVVEVLDAMPQMRQLTYYNKGLQQCRSSLEADTALEKSFNVCIIITDGLDLSMTPPGEMKEIVGEDTAIFGIFVGDMAANQPGVSFLKSIVKCGLVQKLAGDADLDSECNFFASAEDYTALSAKAHEVAKEITNRIDMVMCAEISALIGVPVALAMCLPYVLFFAMCTGITMYKRRRETNNSRNFARNNLNE